jgi:multiple sugar transport system ATP-binding protein
MATVVLRQIDKVFRDGTHAVRDLTLDVRNGEMLVLVGPSGSGKTTILRTIAGLEKATRGEIRIDDRIVDSLPPHKRNVAMVFQSFALYPHLTVSGNLAFPLRMRKVARADRNRRVAEVAELLGLTALLNRRPSELSGGQQQRVAMGRALVRRPAVLMMDEPLSNLDPPLRAQVRAEISRIQRRTGTTSVYVTHDQSEAMALGDRIAVILEGRLQQAGCPAALYDEPANVFVARFFGNPGMNVFAAKLCRQTNEDRFFECGDWRLPVSRGLLDRYDRLEPFDGESILVGLRPEAFSLDRTADATESLRVRVLGSESLGHETLVYFENPAHVHPGASNSGGPAAAISPKRFAARLADKAELPRPGDELTMHADTHNMALFDAGGQALPRRH